MKSTENKKCMPMYAALQHVKRCYVAVVLLFVAMLAHAQWRTADEAARVLSSPSDNHLSKRSAAKLRDVAKDVKLLHTEQFNGHNTIYVFGRGDNSGVVLVGGLEGIDILGYTDRGNFSIDNMPPALKDMMKSWSEQQNIMAVTWTNSKVQSAKHSTERKSIDHLVQTHWSQHMPYNAKCPDDCLTGCVATMFAQIMKYYNYPNRGIGSHSYTWRGKTLSANFGATEYKWDKMSDFYDSDAYDKESMEAMSTLMYHVGVACEMNYGEDASGASTSPVPLTTYFDYNANAVTRRISGTEEDVQLMYEQLEKGQPIPYAGSSTTGHAFIVDGYRDGMWAINWGWDGSYDGYFRLGEFNPGNSNFSSDNRAILNLVPNGNYTPDAQAKPGEFTVSTPGTLKSMLGKNRYNRLTIHGNINGNDLRELRSRCMSLDYGYIQTVGGLKSLDLSDANIVDGGVYYAAIYTSPSQPDGYVREFTAEANVLGTGAFRMSALEELCLPASITTIKDGAINDNRELVRLTFPKRLITYEDYAVYNSNADLKMVVPEGGTSIVVNNMLYLQDYKRLCLVAGEHDKIVVDEQCNSIAGGAFNAGGCKIGTLVLPRIEGFFNLFNFNVKKLWIAGMASELHMNTSKPNANYDLYLPSTELTTIFNEYQSDNVVNRIYVPRSMLQKYKSDMVWSTYSSRLYAIEDVDVCVDDRHITLPQELSLNVSDMNKLLPLIFDSKIAGKTVEWKSSNTAVATVDDKGKVMALAEGYADITATVNGCTATCHVVVSAWPTVNVETPGSLTQLIKGKDYSYLAVTGNINGEDIRELRARALCYDEGYSPTSDTPLVGLDLTDANIVDGGVYMELNSSKSECVANTIKFMMFSNNYTLKTLLLPNSVKEMESYAIQCYNMQYLRLPNKLKLFGENAIDCMGQMVDLEINVPASSCLVMKDGLLYKKDFSTLYLCLSKLRKECNLLEMSVG